MSESKKPENNESKSLFNFFKLRLPLLLAVIATPLILAAAVLLLFPLLLAIPIWLGRDHTVYPPYYCPAEKRYVKDEEYIKESIELFKDERKFDGKNYSLINCCYITTNEPIDENRVVYVSWDFERSAQVREYDRIHNNYPQHAYGHAQTRHDVCNYRILFQRTSSESEVPEIRHYPNNRFVEWSN